MTEIRVVVAARYIPVPGYIIHLWEQAGGGGGKGTVQITFESVAS
jgi:hypothetical protein